MHDNENTEATANVPQQPQQQGAQHGNHEAEQAMKRQSQDGRNGQNEQNGQTDRTAQQDSGQPAQPALPERPKPQQQPKQKKQQPPQNNKGSQQKSQAQQNPQPQPKKQHNNSRPSKPRKPSSWRILGMDVTQWMRGHLFSIAVALVFFIGNIVYWGIKASRHLRLPAGRTMSLTEILLRNPHPHSPGTYNPIHQADVLPWIGHILRSAVLVRNPILMIIYTLIILVLLAVAQSKMGVWKTIFSSLFSFAVGGTFGLLVCVAVDMGMHDWQRLEQLPVLLSPLTLIIGSLMAASAYTSVLWRRRILLLAYTFIGTLLLFSGNPGDYCTLGAALVGHATGLLMHGPVKDRIHWKRGTDYEIRHLFALAQLVLAIGPLLALTSTSRLGPLTTLGLFASSIWSDSSLLTSCGANPAAQSCILLARQHHIAVAGLWLHMLLPMAALAIVAWGLSRGRRLAAWVSMVLNGSAIVFATLYYIVFPLTITPMSQDLARRYNVMPAFITTVLPPLLLIIFMSRELAHFSIRTSKRQVITGISAIVGMLLVTCAGYMTYALVSPNSFRPRPGVKLLLLDMMRRLLPTGFGGRKATLIAPQTIPATLVSEGLTVVFWLTVLIVFILWFRDHVTEDERGRVQAGELIRHGGESMSFMTTWEGNHYWFSSTGRTGIAYRVLHGIALTVTGPFGDPAEYQQAMREFMAFCETKGWSPSFYAVHDDQREELESLGWSSIQVGTEMVIDPNKWETRGKKWQDIRTAINKAKRDGITDVLTTYNQAGFEIDQQIVEISEQWAQLKALPEMKFTLGGIEELRDERVALLYALDADGKVLGVTSWLPTYREGRIVGWTLDFMRHRTDSPNGTMEFLIARMAERLRDQGRENPENAVEFMSLSAAPLAGMGVGREKPKAAATAEAKAEGKSEGKNGKVEKAATKADVKTEKAKGKPGTESAAKPEATNNGKNAQAAAQPDAAKADSAKAGFSKSGSSKTDDASDKTTAKPAKEPIASPSGTEIIEHALQIVADILEPAYAFKSLFFFKRKFQPMPAPIYICYPDSAKLAQIGIAVVNAYVPELKPAQVVEILKTMTANSKSGH
ncbi:phosphatidylglycerol lysyltransferase domain-containing protein [Bifidobacterium sp. ESL0790]|uniref:bifunctional lysylphosphatidylglycerol flippase/synthetase MprF n=1 Tax=Bifidobacterium sp. ESL0790 TaxID=2983233 RepID=UPI0023FA4354|nr:phosphatidylglycerol lysyltransferase domain-containing protein [Bifidobacterium sp. ESL0790]WEV71912.1 phosphatidylglycerol lysyltransferase domain-containing protein [Bifidobacterium sp. ESL0790]